ncbi:hypothetical protein D3C72_446260 [compost metagenome]
MEGLDAFRRGLARHHPAPGALGALALQVAQQLAAGGVEAVGVIQEPQAGLEARSSKLAHGGVQTHTLRGAFEGRRGRHVQLGQELHQHGGQAVAHLGGRAGEGLQPGAQGLVGRGVRAETLGVKDRLAVQLRLGARLGEQAALALAGAACEPERDGREVRRDGLQGRLGLLAADDRGAQQADGHGALGLQAERIEQVAGGAETLGGVFGEQLGDGRVELARDLGGMLAQAVGLRLEVCPQEHHRPGGARLEGRTAGHHMEDHGAEAVEVGAAVDGGLFDRFGSQVEQRAANRAARAAGAGQQAQIHQLGDAVLAQADVLGLEVAVDVAAAMQVGQGGGDAGQPVAHLRFAEGLLLFVEVVARHDLHGHVGRAVFQLAVIMGRDQVRVAQRRHRPELLLEQEAAFLEVRVAHGGQASRREGLQCHVLAALAIEHEMHGAHASLAQEAAVLVTGRQLLHGGGWFLYVT